MGDYVITVHDVEPKDVANFLIFNTITDALDAAGIHHSGMTGEWYPLGRPDPIRATEAERRRAQALYEAGE